MAYEMHPRCELMWGYDELVERSFGKFYPGIDILSICVPARRHLQEIHKQITFIKPKAFLLEKPMAMTVSECDQIIDVCLEYSIVLAINHQRAWELGGTVEWSGDPLENGAHAAELANRLHLNLSRKVAPYASLSINTYAGGPMVSLRAIDDIIACIEGRKEKPACDGWAGREAVRVALEEGFGGGTIGEGGVGTSVVLARPGAPSPG